MNRTQSHLPRRTAIAAAALCCFCLGPVATNAFVTPSSRSVSFLVPESATNSRNGILSPSSLSFENRKHDKLSRPNANLRNAAIFSASTASTALTSDQKSILSVGLWCVLDIAFRRLFQYLNIATKFPSSLAGCGVILAVLLASKSSSSTKESKLHRLLTPGAALLAKWLPVFFVPSLVTLPLVGSIESLGGSTEILKALAVILGGFYFTLLTTAGSVIGIGKLMGKKEEADSPLEPSPTPDAVEEESTDDFESAMPETPAPAPKVFSDDLMKRLRILAIFSGLAAMEGVSPVFSSFPARMLVKFQTPVLSLLLGSTTLASFVYGSRLPKKFKKIVHPLVTCTSLTWAVMALFGKVVERSFSSMLTSYKMGKGFNGLAGTGAGDVLLFMLGPAVMSLAISMYDKRELIRDNFLQIATAISVSSVGGLFGTAWMVRLIGLLQPSFRVALLSRNITSPLAMAIAGLLGASTSGVGIAVAIVVVTGLFGANFGAASLTAAGVKNPVARGMGIGAAAHGLGTAAFVDEKDAFPFAAISMALTATACTCLVSVPAIKKLVLSIALNGAV